jgi:hypothetical protein
MVCISLLYKKKDRHSMNGLTNNNEKWLVPLHCELHEDQVNVNEFILV